MAFRDIPIQKKLIRLIFLISGVVLFTTCITFFIYEFYTFRQATVENLTTIGKIISTNSTAALAFNNPEDAKEILAALKSEPHIVMASLYDKDGKLFSQYPINIDIPAFPVKPNPEGYNFTYSFVEVFQPVIQENITLGSLYLKSDLGAMYKRFRIYGIIMALAIFLSFLFAYLLSITLKKTISKPILALAETAKIISDQGDYSVRVTKLAKDELGMLTDAFNQMLVKIQTQTLALNEFNKNLEQKINERTEALELVNKELKYNEQQIQAIFNSAPDAVIVINHESSIVKWNHKAEKLFGWDEAEVIERPLYEYIIPERYRERHKSGMKHYLSTGEGPVLNKDMEIEAINRKGMEFNVLLSISPVDIKDKILFIGFIRDITEKKKNEILLKQKSEELERSNNELEQFAYVASHDLQEPLRMVNSYLQLLEKRYKDKLDNDAKDFINYAVDGSNRMRTLIFSLLDYSRINRVKPFEDIDLNVLLKEVLGDLSSSIKENNATITIETLPIIYGDKVLIGQLFQNLISNAVKFKGERNPEILISGKKDNKEYLFSIKDNGIGIQKEYASKLFVIFQRLNTKEQYPGTGIGLAICKKIVEKHGGKIWFESEFGKGATFYFTIKEKEEKPKE